MKPYSGVKAYQWTRDACHFGNLPGDRGDRVLTIGEDNPLFEPLAAKKDIHLP